MLKDLFGDFFSGGAPGTSAELGRYLQGQPTGVSDLPNREDRKICDNFDDKALKLYEKKFGKYNPGRSTIGLEDFKKYMDAFLAENPSLNKYYNTQRMVERIRSRAHNERN